MRSLSSLAIAVICCFSGYSQVKNSEPSVEKSIFGLQVGILSFSAHNEYKLSNKIAFRSEIGFNTTILTNDNNTIVKGFPSLVLEPRLYYNLNKRISKSKNIEGNSGNYFSLKTTYYFGDNTYVQSFIPTWGMRRNLGKHFNYEFGLGIGSSYIDQKFYLTPYLDFKIGYKF